MERMFVGTTMEYVFCLVLSKFKIHIKMNVCYTGNTQ